MSSPQWLLLAALAFAGGASAGSSAPTYQTQTLEGWTFRIDDRLLTAENKPATDKALALMAAQLKEVVRLVPAGPVAQLRKVTLWLSPPYPNEAPRATYHVSENWMRQNGRNLVMLKSIEFSNVFIFEKEARRMPMLMLHELSHAYHDQVLGWEHDGLAAVYARAMTSKRYDCVERRRAPEQPSTFQTAYAMSDVGEYFAETTEAFFGRNDFYPFTREELGKHDPDMLALLQQVWQVTPATAGVPPTKSTPPVPAAFDARCYYRLTTLWQGEGMSLDILSDGKADNVPILARSGDYSGQMWKLTPEANGYYRLTTLWRGPSLSLASTAGNLPRLVKSAAVPEQRWKLIPEPNGIYRLTTQAQGNALSLDIVNDSRANNIPVLAKTGCSDSGQLWKVTTVRMNPDPDLEDSP